MSRLVLGALGLALILTGCPAPQIAQPDDFNEDPARLLTAIKQRADAVQALSGEVGIEVWHGADRVRLKQLLAVDRQGRVRIDALSPFGQPLSTLVSDGSRLMIYSLEDKTFRIGAATAENMARLMPIRLEPEALSAILRGAVPILEHDQATVTWNARDGWYRLELVKGSRMQRIEFEPQALRVVNLEQRDGDAVRYTARFGAYAGEGDAVIPTRMRFEAPGPAGDALRIDLEVIDHTLNPELPPEVFTLEAPRGVRVEAL